MDTWALATVAFLLLVFAALSHRLKRSYVTLAIFFTSAGLLAGPVLGLLDLELGSEPIKLLAEATLTLVLFSDASRISIPALRRRVQRSGAPPRARPSPDHCGRDSGRRRRPPRREPRRGARPRRHPGVHGRRPRAGGRDGQAHPVPDPAGPQRGERAQRRPLRAALLHRARHRRGRRRRAQRARRPRARRRGDRLGVVGGIAAGALGAVALRTAQRRGLAEAHWLQILTAATALLAAGIAHGLGGSIFIAAFVGGFVFGGVRRDVGGEVGYLVDQGGEVLNAVTFLVFGAVILGPALDDLGWEAVLYAVLSLTVVRMLPVALATLGTRARPPTIAFLGWFGPRGLASIVFAVILVEEAALPHQETLLLAVVATVGLSVYAHGLSALPLTERYVAGTSRTRPSSFPRWRACRHPSSRHGPREAEGGSGRAPPPPPSGRVPTASGRRPGFDFLPCPRRGRRRRSCPSTCSRRCSS